MKEIHLPSRRTCLMRPMTWLDWIVSATAPSFDMRIMLTACRLTTIDGKPLSVDEASVMSMAEAAPLIAAVTAELAEAYAKPEETPPAGVTLQ